MFARTPTSGPSSDEARGSGPTAASATRREAERWLDRRLDGAPARLGELVRELLVRAEPEEPPEEVADWLAWAAYQEFLTVDGTDQEEDAALRLLAADAALTYAFEAAAEADSDLAAMARSWGPGGRLGRELAARLEARAAEEGAG